MTHAQTHLPGPPPVAKPGDRWFCPCCGTKHTAVVVTDARAVPDGPFIEWVPDLEWGVRDDA